MAKISKHATTRQKISRKRNASIKPNKGVLRPSARQLTKLQGERQGTKFPNDWTLSGLLGSLRPQHFRACTSEQLDEDKALAERDERNGKSNCRWFKDGLGRNIVCGLNLAGGKQLLILQDRFSSIPKRVCVIYLSEDKAFVDKLARKLCVYGAKPWLSEQIPAGADWPSFILNEMESCDYTVAVMSKHYGVRNRSYFYLELRYAIMLQKQTPFDKPFLFVIRVDNTEIPAELRSIQHIDAFPATCFESSMRKLARAMELLDFE